MLRGHNGWHGEMRGDLGVGCGDPMLFSATLEICETHFIAATAKRCCGKGPGVAVRLRL